VLWLRTLTELPRWDQQLREQGVLDDELAQSMLQPAASRQDTDLLQVWVQHWRSLWPSLSGRNRQGLWSLIRMLQQHWAEFPQLPVDKAWSARQELDNALRFYFRRHVLQPGAAFAYLALLALCLERLRGELLRRILFAPRSRR